jgi:hypothetical protein
MVTGTRSVTGGRGRGRGRGRDISPHVSDHEIPIQEENREENQGEQHADSEEMGTRHMMRLILERLPPPKDAEQEESHHEGHRERQRSRSPRGDHHGDRQRSIKATQMRDLQRVKIKAFTGEGTGSVAEQWLIALDRCFTIQDFDSNVKARFAIGHLESFAAIWWNIEEKKLGIDMHTVTWELFLDNFRDRFLPEQWQQQRADEFHNLKQYTMSVAEYERKFYELMPYAGISDSSPLMVQHFIRGLNNRYIGGVKVFEPKTLKHAIRQAILVEQNVTSRHGGFVGAPSSGHASSGPRGTQNQGTVSNKKPPFFRGN